MWIIKYKKIFLSFSAMLVIGAIVVTAVFGIQTTIEFAGGSVTEVVYETRPELDQVKTILDGFDFEAQVQNFGEHGVIIRTRELTEADRGVLLAALEINEQVPELERFSTIGPTIGQELRRKAILALILVALAIVIYIAFVFRRVSKPVSSWKYGVIAIIALLHDVLIPIGIFALLGREVGTLFVVGLLSILGLSVNDTIVVFDRVRENLGDADHPEEDFDTIVGQSLQQTIARSINTSLTLLVVLITLFVAGPPATRDLALVLFIGTILGTYSSIFVASPLLTLFKPKTTGK